MTATKMTENKDNNRALKISWSILWKHPRFTYHSVIDWLIVLGFNTTLTDKFISWQWLMHIVAVDDAYHGGGWCISWRWLMHIMALADAYCGAGWCISLRWLMHIVAVADAYCGGGWCISWQWLMHIVALADVHVFPGFLTSELTQWDRKHGGKRRKCWLPAFSPFSQCFWKSYFSWSLKPWLVWQRVYSFEKNFICEQYAM